MEFKKIMWIKTIDKDNQKYNFFNLLDLFKYGHWIYGYNKQLHVKQGFLRFQP